MTATLFHNVQILDSTGADPYPGDVLVEDDRIAVVGTVDPARSRGARVIEMTGSPGWDELRDVRSSLLR